MRTVRADLERAANILLPAEIRTFTITFLTFVLGSGPVVALLFSQIGPTLNVYRAFQSLLYFLPVLIMQVLLARFLYKILDRPYKVTSTNLVMIFLGSLVGTTLRLYVTGGVGLF